MSNSVIYDFKDFKVVNDIESDCVLQTKTVTWQVFENQQVYM